jgi:hypothetical protein
MTRLNKFLLSLLSGLGIVFLVVFIMYQMNLATVGFDYKRTDLVSEFKIGDIKEVTNLQVHSYPKLFDELEDRDEGVYACADIKRYTKTVYKLSGTGEEVTYDFYFYKSAEPVDVGEEPIEPEVAFVFSDEGINYKANCVNYNAYIFQNDGRCYFNNKEIKEFAKNLIHTNKNYLVKSCDDNRVIIVDSENIVGKIYKLDEEYK